MGQSNSGEDGEPEQLLEVTEERCEEIIKNLLDEGILDWTTIAKEMLQSLQPPQTATHVPQLDGHRERYERGNRWAPSRRWMYSQYGPCESCGKITSINHDHIVERDILGNEADRLENLRFLCRRCNQSRHWEKGNVLDLGTAAAVMYLLFTQEPKTVKELEKMGRQVGLTQSNQRFEETWAFAMYLHREGLIEVDEVHPVIDEGELEQYQEYYSATKEYFKELNERLRDQYPDEMRIKNNLEHLVRGRKTKVEDRIDAARELNILSDDEVEQILRNDTKLTDSEKRKILEAVGTFNDGEMQDIVNSRKVSLYHVLNTDQQEAVIQEIDEKMEEFQDEYLEQAD